jgi:hypothetical protein
MTIWVKMVKSVYRDKTNNKRKNGCKMSKEKVNDFENDDAN